ncbi:MAG: nucleoside-triphosphatase [bacterium]
MHNYLTFLIHKVLSFIRREGRGEWVAGFYTEEIREGGSREGFRIKTLSG